VRIQCRGVGDDVFVEEWGLYGRAVSKGGLVMNCQAVVGRRNVQSRGREVANKALKEDEAGIRKELEDRMTGEVP